MHPDSKPPPPWLKVSLALALPLALALAAATRLSLYRQTPHPLGTDGYYYVVQLESLASLGHLHVPDPSWVFYWLSLVAQGLGDPIEGVKVAVALLLAMAIPFGAWAGWRLGGVIGALTLGLWVALSPTLTHLGGDFPKNAGVVVPLLCLLGTLNSRGAQRGPWVRDVPLGGLAFALCAGAHRVGAVLGALALLGWCLGKMLERGGAPLRRWSPAGLIGFGIIFALALGVLGGEIPQLARILPQLDPALRLPAPFPYLSLRETSPIQILELSLAAPILLWAILKGGSQRLSLILPLSLCILPLWRVDALDLGYRLSLLAPLFAAPLLGSLLGGDDTSPTLTIERPNSPLALGVLIAIGSLLALPFVPRQGFDPQALPPYDTYHRVIDAIPRPLPVLLIAHQGINFYYDHLTGEEAMAWAPEPELDLESVGRVVYGVTFEEWLYYLNPEAGEGATQVQSLGAGYHYIGEAGWQALLRAAKAEGDDALLERILTWQNPHRVRPQWMMSGRNKAAP